MSQEIQEQSNNQEVDIIFVIGPDNEGRDEQTNAIENFKRDCENKKLSYVILGDGKTAPKFEAIDSLPKTKHLVVWGHGSVDQQGHYIDLFSDKSDSQKIIKGLQNQTGAKNIVALSCYAGKIVDDMKNLNDSKDWLAPGTHFFTPSPQDEISFITSNINAIHLFIDQVHKDTTSNNELKFFEFVQNVIEAIPETSIYAHMPIGNDEKLHPIKSCTLHINDKTKENVYAKSESFTAYLIAQLNVFIQEELINKNLSQGLGDYQNQCVMNNNALVLDRVQIEKSRSNALNYNNRHKNYRYFLFIMLIFKNKANILNHVLENNYQEISTRQKQAQECLHSLINILNQPDPYWTPKQVLDSLHALIKHVGVGKLKNISKITDIIEKDKSITDDEKIKTFFLFAVHSHHEYDFKECFKQALKLTQKNNHSATLYQYMNNEQYWSTILEKADYYQLNQLKEIVTTHDSTNQKIITSISTQSNVLKTQYLEAVTKIVNSEHWRKTTWIDKKPKFINELKKFFEKNNNQEDIIEKLHQLVDQHLKTSKKSNPTARLFYELIRETSLQNSALPTFRLNRFLEVLEEKTVKSNRSFKQKYNFFNSKEKKSFSPNFSDDLSDGFSTDFGEDWKDYTMPNVKK